MLVSDQLIKAIPFNGTSRALIVQRTDGRYSYRMQFVWQLEGRIEWSPPGPYAGVYDTAEAAEQEARSRRAARST
jgi:hypothetical protein